MVGSLDTALSTPATPTTASAAPPMPRHDASAAILRLRERAALVAAHRGGVPHRCRLPGDLRERGPDHATIARFFVDHEAAIEATFIGVLRLCAAAGLVSVGTIAIDGTKIRADAALDKNRGADWIRAEVARIMAEAAATDAAEDTQPELFDTDVLPAELSTRTGRRARMEVALAEIEAQEAAAGAEAKQPSAPPKSRPPWPSAPNSGAADPAPMTASNGPPRSKRPPRPLPPPPRPT